MTEPVFYREEVVRVLFTLYDMTETLADIYAVLSGDGDDDEEEEQG